MDEKKKNDEKEQITAEDLIKRLKSNIMSNPGFSDSEETPFEENPEKVIAKTPDKISEETKLSKIKMQEELETIQPAPSRRFRFRKKNEEPVSKPFKSGNTAAAMKSAEAEKKLLKKKEEVSQKKEAEVENVKAPKVINTVFGQLEEEPEIEREAPVTEINNIVSLLENDKNSQKQKKKSSMLSFEEMIGSADDQSEKNEKKTVTTEKEPTKEIELIEEENTSIFVPQAKPEKTNLFKEEKEPEKKKESPLKVSEVEQLSFSLDDDDIQKSIQEAEAFIYDRERIENPGDVLADNNTEQKNDSPVLPEEPEEEEENENDNTDVWIASAFEDESSLKDMFGEEAASDVQTQLDIDMGEYLKKEERPHVDTVKIDEEYVSPDQNKEIFKKYKQLRNIGLIKLFASLVLVVVAFFFENIGLLGGSLSGALDPKAYPVVHILASMQILFFICAVAYKQFYLGGLALIRLRLIPESFTTIVAAVSVIIHVVLCFIADNAEYIPLYIFPVAVCVFFTLLYDFLNLKREIFTFNILASKKQPKYTINKVESESGELESQAFGEYVAETDAEMFKIGKTKFVNGFRERMNSYPQCNSMLNIFLPLTVAIGIVFTIIGSVLYGFVAGVEAGYLAFMLSSPISLLISYSYPFYRASKGAFDEGSAIVGDASLSEYSRANTLSFDDKDVFPSEGVKVKSIKVYGESRIDRILYNASSMFHCVGGPLSDVFRLATLELGHSEDIELIESAKDGLEFIVEGEHILVGKASYISEKGYMPISDPDDSAMEENGDTSIMFMVCGNEVAAKMYIQYLIDPDFIHTLKQLYKAGMCVGIKTFDPNIDDRMLSRRVNLTKYPVRILRCRSIEDMQSQTDEVESGIVSKRSPRSLLQAFVLCGKVMFASKASMTVKFLSIVFSVLMMAALFIFGGLTSIASLYVVLYQVFWLIPVYIISRIYIN